MTKGVARIFHWGAKPEQPKAESGDGVLGEGQQPATPPHQLEGLGERCELSQRGSGQCLDRPKVFCYPQHCRMASPDIIILLIVDYHAAMGEARPPCSPLRTPLHMIK